MKKFFSIAFSLSLFLFAAISLHAQGTPLPVSGGGCTDSPEAPTEVLMAVGAAGMLMGPSLLAKLKRIRKN